METDRTLKINGVESRMQLEIDFQPDVVVLRVGNRATQDESKIEMDPSFVITLGIWLVDHDDTEFVLTGQDETVVFRRYPSGYGVITFRDTRRQAGRSIALSAEDMRTVRSWISRYHRERRAAA